LAPAAPRVPVERILVGVHSLTATGDEAVPPLEGLRVHGVVGIARPERFRSLLEEAGAEVAGWSVYRDHHAFRPEELRREEKRAAAIRARPVTTAKDAVRLEASVDPEAGWLRTEIELRVEGGWRRFLLGVLNDD